MNLATIEYGQANIQVIAFYAHYGGEHVIFLALIITSIAFTKSWVYAIKQLIIVDAY